MKRGRADSLIFVGDAISIAATRAYCTTADDETIASAAAKFVAKQRTTLQLNRRMLQHVHGYAELKAKTKLQAGTWLVLPEQQGAAVEARVIEYLGWDLAGQEQQWRVQAQEGANLTLTVDATTLFAGLGWVTVADPTSRVGVQVVTAQGRKAEVVAYYPPGRGLDARPLWKVRHDDDDFEDLEERELVQALGRAGSDAIGSGQSMSVAEIIASETAAIQKKWKEQKAAEGSLGLTPVNGSIFPGIVDAGTGSSDDDAVLQPVRIVKVKKLKVTAADDDTKPRSPTTPRTSRYTGVTWEKRTSKWQAKIYNGVRMQHLGTFPEDKEEAAARAFDEAALRLRGAQARLNFPSDTAHNEDPGHVDTSCSSLASVSSVASSSSLMSSLPGTEDDLITIDDDAGIFTIQDPWCVGA
jgi:hypothetical protein